SAPAWVDLGERFHSHLDPTIEVPGGVSTAPGSGREPGRGRPGRASSGIEAGLPGVELVLQGDGHGGDGPVGGDGAGPPDIGALALDVDRDVVGGPGQRVGGGKTEWSGTQAALVVEVVASP